MENYTVLFPGPASSSSGFQMPASAMGGSYHGFSNFEGQISNGFLGLRPSHDQSLGDLQKRGEVRDGQLSQSGNGKDDQIGGGTGKKKGEKKVRKPRFAFQTRSQVDILDDGYRWRKYGQKAVKNNKFPRSYYRCTHQGCNVKKQVQRLTKDEGVVVTTYEGVHTHPIEKTTDNFEHILSQMHIYTPF
ncbi:probable WRKY transcription factor 75 [Prosopis cineraria]|uniref:probable WRKY transcription factor 75 n=1 Tax=Prosopis cineraria TaxID=364024 RepID=UPI00240FD4EB|nr:probable WRKY transcription factor 75 [Prosopis cineraria]